MKSNFIRISKIILLLSVVLIWSSCRNDLDFEKLEGDLIFSKDTVYLDTIFSNIGSSTYTLKVYNNSNSNILIPRIRLQNGPQSSYRLNVDGMTGDIPLAGNEFTNVELLAKDSMYVFIETTVDIQELVTNENQYLYTDRIEFGENDIQKVELITLVKDAIFIYPQQFISGDGTNQIETLNFDIDGDGIEDQTSIQGRFLQSNELNFTNEKPYVIYGYAAVNNGDILNIEAGARLHFHYNSGLLITDNASIHSNGMPSDDQSLMENEIIFEGNRLEDSFSEIPGQWQTIWLFSGSTNNKFNHTTIKNSTIGILCDGNQEDENKLEINNTQIYNSSNFGILGRATNIKCENLVINKSGQSSFAATIGGQYDIIHATIANYWSYSFRQFPSLLLNNFSQDSDQNIIPNNLTKANFTNCIIYGNDNPELLLDNTVDADFNLNFKNCLLLFNDPNNFYDSPYYNFNDINLYENIILNSNPDFLDPDQNKLQISIESPASGYGITTGELSTDILGNQRTAPVDLGAYNAINFEN